MTVEFTLSIDRTSLSLTPLVLSGVDDASVWGVLAGWQMPGKDAVVIRASSPLTHGSTPTHWKWQDAVMSGEVAAQAASTGALAAAIADLEAAIGRLEYDVEVTRNGVPWGTWRCGPGSLTPSPLDYVNLRDDQQAFSLTIPCFPVAS